MILAWASLAVSEGSSVVKLSQKFANALSDYFTKNIDRTWRLLENLEAGMIGMNTGNASAAETPFGGIKESGYGKESGKDVAIAEYLVSILPAHMLDKLVANYPLQITKTGTLTLADHY